jgi:hypothetical protein
MLAPTARVVLMLLRDTVQVLQIASGLLGFGGFESHCVGSWDKLVP